MQSLSQPDYELLRRSMEPLSLTRGTVLGNLHDPVAHAYFPVEAVISLMGATLDGFGVEIGMVGREGYLGLPILLGKPVHMYRSIVQHTGAAWRISAAALQDSLEKRAVLRDRLLEYTSVRFVQFAQTAICHRFHSLEQRLCRWLLSIQDRVGFVEIHVTHEDLAELIGGRRPTINTITNALKKARVLEYRRGSLIILDRQDLERRACECYNIVAHELAGLAKDRRLSPA